jgi:hypothetical protein
VDTKVCVPRCHLSQAMPPRSTARERSESTRVSSLARRRIRGTRTQERSCPTGSRAIWPRTGTVIVLETEPRSTQAPALRSGVEEDVLPFSVHREELPGSAKSPFRLCESRRWGIVGPRGQKVDHGAAARLWVEVDVAICASPTGESHGSSVDDGWSRAKVSRSVG